MVIMRLESLSVDITNSKAPSFQLFATKETNNWVSNEASMHFDAVKCGFDLYMHFSGSVQVVNELVIKNIGRLDRQTLFVKIRFFLSSFFFVSFTENFVICIIIMMILDKLQTNEQKKNNEL